MTIDEDAVTRAINDARALLSTLISSEWQELHVVSGDTEIFVARAGGGANPMRAPQLSEVIEEPAAEPELQVKAPHVATIVASLQVGTLVSTGQKVATLRVLDEEKDVLSPISGTIVRIDAELGALVEYDDPLLSLVQVA